MVPPQSTAAEPVPPPSPPAGAGSARAALRRPPLTRRVVESIRTSPAYAIAIFLHAVVLVVLSFWTVATAGDRTAQPVDVRVVATSDLEVPERSEDGALDQLFDAPELPSEAPTDDPFEEARGELADAFASDTVPLLGTASGGAGGGRGGQTPRRGGASRASDGSVDAGLEWLVRHRTDDGGWGEVDFRHRPGGDMGEADAARTGLGLLCFLSAGHAPGADGPYREVVDTAEAWLVEKVTTRGVFAGPGHPWSLYYRQAIATLALSEALARRDRPELREAVERAVGFLERSRRRFGWRYPARQDADTSVNGWVVLALKGAEHAGVAVAPESFEVVRRWLERVSTEGGTTGYTHAANDTEAMNATGLFLRIMLGEAPTTARNRAAARIVGRQARLERRGREIENLYGAYYAALAMYQVGGELWREFNPKLRDALVGAQRRGRACDRGAWHPGGHTADWVLATTFATLTLETYYRYLPVHDGLGEEPAPAGDLSPGAERLEAAVLHLDAAREGPDPGGLLMAEAALEEAAATLAEEDEPRSAELLADARARLVEVALLARDRALLKRRLTEYLAAVPDGEEPDARILRLHRLELVRAALEPVDEALGRPEPPDEAELARLLDGLAAAERALERELAGLEGEARAEAEEHLAQLDAARTGLVFAGSPDEAIATALRELEGEAARGPLRPVERRLAAALLRRALRAFERAAAGPDAAAFARGEADLARLEARRLRTRLLPEERARLAPFLAHTAVARMGALAALDRPDEALVAAREFAAAHPDSELLAQVEAVERGALADRVARGVASAAERARLEELLIAWSRRGPELGLAERVLLADALLEAGALPEARRHYAAALEQAGSPKLHARSRLGLSRIARRQGDPAAALAQLDAVGPAGRDLLAVRLERGLALRALGRPRDALAGYVELLRALEEGRPPEWWDVAEAVARTYVEADDLDAARGFLDDLRRLDPTFGGEEDRRERFVDLMIRLDRM